MISNWMPIFSLAEKQHLYKILTQLKNELDQGIKIAPQLSMLFSALSILPNEVKVIICGQDPYHTQNMANGYAFAVNQDSIIPPSLKNIFLEINNDLGEVKTDRTLSSWVQQGVLLLNNTLTVQLGKPNSHLHLGWEQITQRILIFLSEQQRPLVFLLWGQHARNKKALLAVNSQHLILESAHPSPFSCKGFFNQHHFSKTNEFLTQHQLSPIIW